MCLPGHEHGDGPCSIQWGCAGTKVHILATGDVASGAFRVGCGGTSPSFLAFVIVGPRQAHLLAHTAKMNLPEARSELWAFSGAQRLASQARSEFAPPTMTVSSWVRVFELVASLEGHKVSVQDPASTSDASTEGAALTAASGRSDDRP